MGVIRVDVVIKRFAQDMFGDRKDMEAEPAADLDAGQRPKSPKVRWLHKHWQGGNEIASAGWHYNSIKLGVAAQRAR